MIDLLIFIPIALILCGTGQKLLGFIVPSHRFSFLEQAIVGYGLGAGSLALAVLAIGLSGLLYRWVLILFLLMLFIISRKNIATTVKDLAEDRPRILKTDLSSFERFLILAMCFVCLFTLIGSLSPTLGMDSAAYHMQYPKIFIQGHKIIPIPYTRESLWPFVMQMFFTFGLCLKGVILAKLFHFSFYLASILAIYMLCRRYWARSGSVLAAAIFATIPAIFTVTTYAYTDLAVVFFTIMAFYGFFMWLDTDNNRWFYLSGIMCGILLGVKLTSATVPVLIFALGLIRILRRRTSFREKAGPLAFFWFVVLLVCGVWYVRSWIVLGNPIYPFAARFFGGHGYPHIEYAETAGIGWGLKQFIMMLWPLSLSPDIFGGESIGIVFLIFLPMLVFERKLPRFVRYVLVITASMYAAWFFVYQYTRFFFPTLGFMSILAAFACQTIRERDPWVRKWASGLIVLIFCYSAALSIYHNANKLPVVFGFQSQHDYLLKHERTYELAEYVNRNLPPEARVLMMNEVRTYYFNRATLTLMGEWEWKRNRKAGQNFRDFLKKLGFGEYIVVKQDRSRNAFPGAPWALDQFAGEDVQVLKKTEFSRRDEHFVYELWKIPEKMRS